MSRKKNVALLLDCIGSGGAEKVIINLADGIEKLGHNAHIITLRPDIEQPIPKGIKLHDLGYTKDARLKNIKQIHSALDKFSSTINNIEQQYGKFNLFLANSDITNYLLAHSSNLSPKYFVIHNNIDLVIKQVQYHPLKYWRKIKVSEVLNNQKLIGVSNGVIDCIHKGSRIEPASTQTIYNPFNFQEIRHLSNQKEKNIPNTPYIIHAARAAKQKRHDILFQAIKDVPQEYKIVLLSDNNAKLQKLAKKHGVQNRIITPGFQKNPYPWYKHAQLMVLSSDFEGLPTVLIESLICGTPVVSTDCDYGPREILTGHFEQFLCPVREPSSLATIINKALDNYPDVNSLPILDKIKVETIAQQYLSLAN